MDLTSRLPAVGTCENLSRQASSIAPALPAIQCRPGASNVPKCPLLPASAGRLRLPRVLFLVTSRFSRRFSHLLDGLFFLPGLPLSSLVCEQPPSQHGFY